MAYEKTAVIAKYDAIDLDGQRAFKEGWVKKFTGFPPEWSRRFIVSALFHEQFQIQIEERLLKPLSEIASGTGLLLMLGRRDYPLHVTIQETPIKEEEEQDVAALFEKLATESRRCVGSCLSVPFVFNRLLADRVGSIFIAATDIPPIVHDLRCELIGIFGKSLKPFPLDNILHCSLARITGFREAEKEKPLASFWERLELLKTTIRERPLTLWPERIYAGDTLSFLQGQPVKS